jgi:pSer/pThr/pTyr-binding forkhead associated (FHA) protein
MAELVLRLRDREMARTGIQNASMTIGWDASCDRVVDNAAVSRKHAVVMSARATFACATRDSKNGNTVNGKRVRNRPDRSRS